jgi:hypothetical protein
MSTISRSVGNEIEDLFESFYGNHVCRNLVSEISRSFLLHDHSEQIGLLLPNYRALFIWIVSSIKRLIVDRNGNSKHAFPVFVELLSTYAEAHKNQPKYALTDQEVLLEGSALFDVVVERIMALIAEKTKVGLFPVSRQDPFLNLLPDELKGVFHFLFLLFVSRVPLFPFMANFSSGRSVFTLCEVIKSISLLVHPKLGKAAAVEAEIRVFAKIATECDLLATEYRDMEEAKIVVTVKAFESFLIKKQKPFCDVDSLVESLQLCEFVAVRPDMDDDSSDSNHSKLYAGQIVCKCVRKRSVVESAAAQTESNKKLAVAMKSAMEQFLAGADFSNAQLEEKVKDVRKVMGWSGRSKSS